MPRSFPLGSIKDQDDPRDYRLAPAQVIPPLPPSVDYEKQMSPIRDQGQRGSCVSMATVAVKEWQERKQHGFKHPLDLSEEWVYDQIMLDGGGAYPRDAMKLLDASGVCQEKYLPYKPSLPDDTPPQLSITSTEKRSAAHYKAKSYVRLHTLNDMLATLAVAGPFTLAVDWLDGWFNPGQQFDGYPVLSPGEGTSAGGHDVAIVSYDQTAKVLKFRNSWGPEWGKGGYAYFTFDAVNANLNDAWASIDIEKVPLAVHKPGEAAS